jgi:diaminopimelate decarboxylase
MGAAGEETMSIKAALVSHLKHSVGVSAHSGDQVYRGLAARTATGKYIVFRQLSGIPARHLSAVSGVKQTLFQIDCWADTEEDADDLADAVRDALDQYQGTLGHGANTASRVTVFIDGPRDDFAPPDDGGRVKRFRALLEAAIWYDETAPGLN